MSDRADIVRNRLLSGAHSVHTQPAALAALAAIVAERDKTREALAEIEYWTSNGNRPLHMMSGKAVENIWTIARAALAWPHKTQDGKS